MQTPKKSSQIHCTLAKQSCWLKSLPFNTQLNDIFVDFINFLIKNRGRMKKKTLFQIMFAYVGCDGTQSSVFSEILFCASFFKYQANYYGIEPLCNVNILYVKTRQYQQKSLSSSNFRDGFSLFLLLFFCRRPRRFIHRITFSICNSTKNRNSI